VLGRIIGQGMSEALGQQVIIENVGGAGGMTGSVRVAQAAPDGYTMVLGSVGTHAQNQTLYKHPLIEAPRPAASKMGRSILKQEYRA
jgi:tripartite-type tricarboxylate transporter receptor subunit TctC